MNVSLEKAHRQRREMAERGELGSPEHNWIKKANLDPASKVKAIAAMCFNCMGGTEDELPDGGWKDMIRTCSAPKCPLYPHRPYK